MALTKKEFVKIAAALAAEKPDPKHATVGEKRLWSTIVRRVADVCGEGNPRFDRDRFLTACGHEGHGTVKNQ